MKVYFIAKRYFGLVILPVMVLSCFALANLVSEQSLAGKILVIDAGHGGIDPGANRPGVLEKNINLAIALQVRDVLKDREAKVILTRDTDTDLSNECDNDKVRGRYHRDLNARLEAIQESDADLFVSIHANASSKSGRRGIECYYNDRSEAGKLLALTIQEQLSSLAPISQAAEPGDFFVLHRNKVPAVLIEVGFITNPEERVLLQSPEYQRKLAAAIARGVEKYYQSVAYKFARLKN